MTGRLSFILTMWYVKNIFVAECQYVTSSFILTMWYVKRTTVRGYFPYHSKFYINYVVCKVDYFTTKLNEYNEFYINYVVCKVCLNKDLSNSILCFILTMWYVKYPCICLTRYRAKVLY